MLKDRRRVGWLVFAGVEGQRKWAEGQRKLVEKARESWSRRGLALGAWRAADPEEARTGDAAAPVVWRTRASGRGMPERVRQPREESGPGVTTLTVVGEDSPATKGKSRLLFFLWGLCKFCGRRLSIKIELF